MLPSKPMGLNAIYVKMSILPEELEKFFSLAKKLNFRGLSVTMPLKERVLSFLDQVDPLVAQMGAVNTILFEGEKLMGFNTDGIGAINAIERLGSIKGKKVVLIGAGGAAKAIAFIAHQRGAQIVILNRTANKAEELAAHVKGRGAGIEKIASEYEDGYDILINCRPEPLPIDPQYILPHSIVMDIKTLPTKGSLLEYAKQKGAKVVYGYEMFINQAIAQIDIWFKDKAKQQDIAKIVSAETLKRIY